MRLGAIEHHLIGRTKDRQEDDWGAEGRVPRVRICRSWSHNPSFFSGQATPPSSSARIGIDARVSGYEGKGERGETKEEEEKGTRASAGNAIQILLSSLIERSRKLDADEPHVE
jgi:hypothetical protein